MARLRFQNNFVSGPSPIPYYVLINATAQSAAAFLITMCNNIIFGDASGTTYPEKFLYPPALVQHITRCKSATRTQEAPVTFSNTNTRSNSLSTSSTASPTLSNTLTNTASRSSSESDSATHTCRPLDNLVADDTCEVLRPVPLVASGGIVLTAPGGLSCSVVSIPYSEWAGKRGAEHSLAIAAVDSRVLLWSSLDKVPPTVDGTPDVIPSFQVVHMLPITLLFQNRDEVLEAVENGKLPGPPEAPLGDGSVNVTFRYPVAFATLQYVGRPTLSKLKYTLGASPWVRCPIPMPGTIEVTLEASRRLFPTALKDVVVVGTSIVTLGGSLTVAPRVVAQLGVATSLRQMSRCESIDMDDEGSYAAYSQMPLNPFGISLGDGGGRRYLRGTLVMSFVYLFMLSCLMGLYTTAAVKLSHKFATSSGRGKARPRAITVVSVLHGYPSSLIAVVSFVIDGAAASGMVLGVLGDGVADRLLGWLVVLLCVAYVAHIIFVTVRAFPQALTSIDSSVISNSSETGEKNETKSSPFHKWRAKLCASTNSWAIVDTQGDEATARHWMARYESYIADLRIPWYCCLEQSTALTICVLSALPIDEMAFCITRGVLCVLLVGGQTLVMVIRRPPVHRWRWLLLSTVLVLQSLTAILAVANATNQVQGIELTMDALGAAVFLLLAIAFILDILLQLRELYISVRKALRTRRRKNTTQREGQLLQNDDEDVPMVLLDQPTLIPKEKTDRKDKSNEVSDLPTAAMASHQQRRPQSAVSNSNMEDDSEAAVVRAILMQFNEYEAQQMDL